MSTHDTILAAALNILEHEGEARFSTRAVCAMAQVTAPTLYHHFGSADGLLSAAVTEAFRQFLESKRAAMVSGNPRRTLRQGWDDYVRFAEMRPRLYASMMGRLLDGARIEAADQAYRELVRNVEALVAEGALALPAAAATELMWSSANAAALLHVTAALRNGDAPHPSVIESIRESTMQIILGA